ncbi:short-chain dehydrogenase [Flavobacterium sp.]|uniref:short-chain dehydrogenase n=1 Tax=Flavobacterium sp. TaxID=239 RepID=UPI00261D35B8|nr:short-chain dehydrogenase [Flavobacterium sp.]MDD2986424.1 short-chain dehydrogenase [Flavobacterium sp.]
MEKERIKKNKWKQLHLYYTYTGFYKFIYEGLKSAFLPMVLIFGALFYVHYNVININEALKLLTVRYSDLTIFSVFFASESILGLLPPDIFIAWTKNTSNPILYLAFLAVLSYAGGVISYLLGKAILLIPSVHHFMSVKMAKHIKNMRKWGGFLIAVGALLPLPFAMAAMAAGMIKFDFKVFLLFALLRFLRFIIYGFAIYQML